MVATALLLFSSGKKKPITLITTVSCVKLLSSGIIYILMQFYYQAINNSECHKYVLLRHLFFVSNAEGFNIIIGKFLL
jgi:hypothetical protein